MSSMKQHIEEWRKTQGVKPRKGRFWFKFQHNWTYIFFQILRLKHIRNFKVRTSHTPITYFPQLVMYNIDQNLRVCSIFPVIGCAIKVNSKHMLLSLVFVFLTSPTCSLVIFFTAWGSYRKHNSVTRGRPRTENY